MTTYAWPDDLRAATVQWRQRSNTQVATSPLTGSVQTQELPGARWLMTVQAAAAVEVHALETLLVKLRGQANRVSVYPLHRPTPRGTWGGTPLVQGTAQVGASLITDGWTAGSTLLAGDFFAVNGELKQVVADATANGSGVMTIVFEPPLRASPADNAPLTLIRPTCTMMLASPEWAIGIGAGTIIEGAIDLVEVWS